MARNEQLIRQHRLLQLLEASRYGRTLRELRDDVVEELGLDRLSERTVRRDLEALQSAGFDVATHLGERGTVWRIGTSLHELPKISATATELLALSVGREMLTPLSGTPFWQGIESIWNKMRSSLPDSVWKHFDQQWKTLVIRGSTAKSYGPQQGILATLNRAIRQHRIVEVEYRSAGDDEHRLRRIEPYSVVLYRGSVYVVAMACEAPPEDAIRHLKLDRFARATALDQRFRPRDDFDPEEHFSNSLGIYKAGAVVDVRIRLDREIAVWVAENPWRPDQRIEEQADGSCHLVLDAVHEPEIVSRVLPLGDRAVVLEPASTRNLLAETARKVAGLYEESGA